MRDRPTGAVDFLHLGPPRHGVRRYGEGLERAVGAQLGASRTAPPVAGIVHLQFSDSLLPASEWLEIVGRLRSLHPDRRVVVTLHDCPGVGHDDPTEDRRRAVGYRLVCDASDAVVVCSESERAALAQCGVTRSAQVIAHLVEDRPEQGDPIVAPRWPTVGVLGFVYPGKGHDTVLEACALARQRVEMVCIGGASAGHDDLVEGLVQDAVRRGVRCRVTGWVEDAQLAGWLETTDVPIMAHPAPAASGSLATWLSASRRPVVVGSAYARELVAAAPGALRLVDPASGAKGLARAIDRALDDPETTRNAGPPRSLGAAVIGAAHLRCYEMLR